MTRKAPEPPPVGSLARDTSSGRIGRVMASGDTPGSKGRWWLRPVEGGLEWDVDLEHLELVANAPGVTP